MDQEDKVIDLPVDNNIPPSSKQPKVDIDGDHDDRDVVFMTTKPMHPTDDDDDACMRLQKGVDLAHQEETPSTEEEHKSFLEGYCKYRFIGPKNCWKTMSKKYAKKKKNPKQEQLLGEKHLVDDHLKAKRICIHCNRNCRHPPVFPSNNHIAAPPSPLSSDNDDDDNDLVIMDNRPVVLALPAQ